MLLNGTEYANSFLLFLTAFQISFFARKLIQLANYQEMLCRNTATEIHPFIHFYFNSCIQLKFNSIIFEE